MEKEEKKVSKKDKLLYTCDTEITLEEYQKLIKYIPSFYWFHVILAAIFELILFLIVGKGDISIWLAIIMYFVVLVIVMIYYKLQINNLARTNYNRQFKNRMYDTKFKTEFYENYFLRISEKITRKITYDEIKKIIETDTNFYIKLSDVNVIIQKCNCDLETISFIRSICPNKNDNRLGNNSQRKIKKVSKVRNPEVVKKVMLILFILTVLMPFISSDLASIIGKDEPALLATKGLIIYWILLPIPILSIILGFKYKRVGYKCQKNIVAGFVVSFLMFSWGITAFFPNYEIEYKNVLKYENIIGFNLPQTGRARSMHFSKFMNDKTTNYTIINIYFNEEDSQIIYNEVINNANWMVSENLKSDLTIYTPQTIDQKNTYISIYNATNNTYNTVPEQTGKYKVYVLTFNQKAKEMTINEYDFEYIK